MISLGLRNKVVTNSDSLPGSAYQFDSCGQVQSMVMFGYHEFDHDYL